MDSVFVYVGLDYHMDSIRVCVLSSSGVQLANRDCPNSWAAVFDLVACYGYPKGCAIEACCGAADFAEELRQQSGWQVKLAHPGYVKRLKQGPDKTDHGDAYLLADLVRVDYLPEVWLAPSETRDLRRLVRYRQQVGKIKREVKQQIRAILREQRISEPEANPWTQAWTQWLRTTDALSDHARWVMTKQLERLEGVIGELEEIKQRLEGAAASDAITQKLLQHRGVGLITALTLRAEIGHFERFQTGKQLARFCGVTPCNSSSGKRQADAGLVRAGNRQLRLILIEAAHRLARWDPRWRELKQRLMKSKPNNVALAAVANRWIRWLFYQMVKPQSREVNEAA